MWLAYFVDTACRLHKLGIENTEAIALKTCEHDLAKRAATTIRSEAVEGDPQLRFRVFSVEVEDEADGWVWSGRKGVVVEKLLGCYGVMKLERLRYSDVVRPATPTPQSALFSPPRVSIRRPSPLRLPATIAEGQVLGVDSDDDEPADAANDRLYSPGRYGLNPVFAEPPVPVRSAQPAPSQFPPELIAEIEEKIRERQNKKDQ